MKRDARDFWTVDAETDPFRHGRIPVPFIWGLYTGSTYHEFETTEQLVEFIREHNVIIYAHNGGKFDFHFMLSYINTGEEITVINGRLVVAKIGSCELRDSWNILPVPFEAFGDKIKIDYAIMEPDIRHLHMQEIRTYLKQDCVGLWEKIDAFEKEFGRNITLASAAMKQWEKIGQTKRPKSTRDFFTKFKPWYNGGRVECFQKGHINGPIHVYDINSAYPTAMLSEHPYTTDYVSLSNPNDFQNTSFIHCSAIANGSLPAKNEFGSMYFPYDDEQREYYVTGWELNTALETGTISKLKIFSAQEFVNKRAFEPYMMHFYKRRLEAKAAGNLALDIFSKLMMTNLYGKFGANPDNYGHFICVPFYELDGWQCKCDLGQHDPAICDGFQFNGMIGDLALMRRDLEEEEAHFINVATAASITGCVRAMLWRAICASKGMVYCDTDSIMCQESEVETGPALGQWKLEGTATDVYVAGKKMYLCEGIFDKKGNPKMASKGVRLEPEQLRRAAMGETVTALNAAPTFSLGRETRFMERRIRLT